MTKLNRILAVLIVLMFALGSVADADAKRKKKRKKKKRRRKAKVEKVVEVPPEVPVEAPAAQPPPNPTPAPDAAADGAAAPAGGTPVEAPPTGGPIDPPAPGGDLGANPATDPAADPAADPGPGPGTDPPAEPTAGGVETIGAAPETAGAAHSEELTAEVPTEAEASELFPLTGALKIGTVVPGVFSPLDAALFGTVEVGYLLPFLGQRLAIVADFSYSRPERISRYENDDPRLPGDGSYRFYFTEDQYSIGLGLLARVFPARSDALFGLNFYGKLTGRLELQRASEGAKAVTGFGQSEETATRGAVFFGAGAEFALGPGAILVELNFAWAPLEHQLTGNVGTGGLGVVAGYAFLFGGG